MRSSDYLHLPLALLQDSLKDLSDERAGQLLKTLLEYRITGHISQDLDFVVTLVAKMITPDIDEQLARERHISEINRANGARGGRPGAENNTAKKKRHPQPKKQAEDYTKFLAYIETNAPYIHRNIKLPTEPQFHRLKEKYGSKLLLDCLLDIENRKDLRKRYSDLSRTLDNWCKIQQEIDARKPRETGREQISTKTFDTF